MNSRRIVSASIVVSMMVLGIGLGQHEAKGEVIILPPFNAEVSLNKFVMPNGEDFTDNVIPANTPFTAQVNYTEDFFRDPDYIKLCFIQNGVEQCQQDTVFYEERSNFHLLMLDAVEFSLEKGEYQYYIEVGASEPRLPGGQFTFKTEQQDITIGQPSGNSNVLFIPGFQGSRLYRPTAFGEDELWVPTRNQDAQQLYLNESGDSIDPSIYTRDIIGTTKNLFSIYEGFMNFMDDNLVGGGIIKEWRPFAYDWRNSVDEIAATPALLSSLIDLAASSDSGKVTIIAHSNGGLIAKMLLNNPVAAMHVDQLILVATPQLGTPQALVSLLHGDDQNLGGGLLVRKSTARELGENMPGAYGLLPSARYFEAVQDPIIQFSHDVKQIYDFRALYGETINNFGEMTRFVLGDNGARKEPAAGDTDVPNVLNAALLTQAKNLHANKLDNWTAPAGVQVIQIAGWGLDTVYGIKYDNCDFCPFGQDLSNLDREALHTIDGDKTVIYKSARVGNSLNSYFFNIYSYNKEKQKNYNHGIVMETVAIHELLEKTITKNLVDLPEHISSSLPSSNDNTRYRLRMKSPVAVHIYDSAGRHTGPIDNPDTTSDIELFEEEIPNSSYFELGTKKYVSFDNEDSYTIRLDGEGTGTFTLEIDEVHGDTVIDTVAYEHVPVTNALTGELTVGNSLDSPQLILDFEGDGVADATIPANGELTLEQGLTLLKQAIKHTEMNTKEKDKLLKDVEKIEKELQKGKMKHLDKELEKMDKEITKLVTKKKSDLSQEESLALREVIAAIRKIL